MALLRKPLIGALLAFAGRLRFPFLFALMAGLFVLDLFVPDAIPFVDEVLLGLLAVAISRWKKDPEGDDEEVPVG